MINYIVTRDHAGAVRPFLESWAGSLASSINLVFYEDLPSVEELPVGTTIFGDLERLDDRLRSLATEVHELMVEAGAHVLNHPRATLGRYELLKRLHERRINPYQVRTVGESQAPRPFPLFLRFADDHLGPRTDLLLDEAQLDRELLRLMLRATSPRHLLEVEFFDTSDADGLYRKYGAFIVDGRVIPRHVQTSDHWMVKGPGMRDPASVRVELEYLDGNPHEASIRQVAEVGRVAFGRIDYAVHGDSLVTWEINTNPLIVRHRDLQTEFTIRKQQRFIPAFIDALVELGAETPVGGSVSLALLRKRSDEPIVDEEHRLRAFGLKYRPVSEMALRVVETGAWPFRRRLVSRWRRRNRPVE